MSAFASFFEKSISKKEGVTEWIRILKLFIVSCPLLEGNKIIFFGLVIRNKKIQSIKTKR